ncbi:methyltransferase domain-containing protein [Gymnodinialimonas sp. 57CJ19]|uniref:class I SAM-dependent methyltransferase n=1 Tax=Gymnodinialimonas sp. 57CJ19 TaxID=3138498 RepID=UPI00313437A2
MPSRAHADGAMPLDVYQSETADQSVRADWSAYATAYDLLSEHNPEYQAILASFDTFLASIETPKLIYDIGGGTGNYTERAAIACPDAEIHLAEPDPGMIAAAKAKMSAHPNITYDNVALESYSPSHQADLIVCVHAIYAMPNPQQRLKDLRRLLRPGGWLFLVDLGRDMDVADWRRYLFRSIKAKHGLLGALRIFWQGREIAKQNSAIYDAQQKGVYWTHSAEELASAVTAAGFEIHREDTVYRGYSDLLVCRAPVGTGEDDHE